VTPGSAAGRTIAVLVLTSALAATFGVRWALADEGLGSPDLVVHATSEAPDPIPKGHAMTYTVTLDNVGGARAHRVTVTVSLPRGLTPIDLPTMDGGACSAVGIDPGAGYTVFCSRRTLEPSGSASVTIEVRIDRNRRCGSIRVTATVAAVDEPADARGDDTSAHTDQVRCEPSMRIDRPARAFARVGDLTTTHFELVNDGETALRVLSLDGPGCSLGVGGSNIRPGSRRSLVCARRITGPGDARVVIHLTAASAQGRTLRASAVAAVDVIHPAITISVPASGISGRAGTSASYRIVVTNSGDTALTHLTVRRGAGIVGHVPSLAPGGAVSLTTTEPLGAVGTHTDRIFVSASDRSGMRVNATATTAIAVLAAVVRHHHPSTAFTGMWAGDRGLAATILLVVGLGALMFGRRRTSLPN